MVGGAKGGGGGEAFIGSKKTPKSPVKVTESNREEIDKVIGEWREEMKEILGEIRGMRGMKESLVGIKEKIRERMREQGNVLKEELEKMKRELGEREAKWQEEKEEMVDRIKKLEEKVKGGEMREGGEEERLEREKGGESLEVKIREIEKKMELRERKERRRNIIVKGLVTKEGEKREVIGKIIREVGVEVEVKDMSRVGTREEGKEFWLVRLGSEEQKREVMKRKRRLKGDKMRITDDLTWRERKIKWKLEEIARSEEGRGKKVWVRYGKIRIGEEWWIWDEEEEVLKDGKGRKRKEQTQGEEKEGESGGRG